MFENIRNFDLLEVAKYTCTYIYLQNVYLYRIQFIIMKESFCVSPGATCTGVIFIHL